MVAPQGRKIVLVGFIITVAVFLFSFFYPLVFIKILRWTILLLLLFTIWFFRDPERNKPDPEKIVSPADGKIMQVEQLEDEGKIYRRISIFMSIFNVHINRVPCTGQVLKQEYSPGKFLPAFNSNSSLENESYSTTIRYKDYEVRVTQIAGLIARRIVNDVEQNQQVKAGEKMGMIKFGSRVDLKLPRECQLLAKKGQKVRAGETEIARWPKEGKS